MKCDNISEQSCHQCCREIIFQSQQLQDMLGVFHPDMKNRLSCKYTGLFSKCNCIPETETSMKLLTQYSSMIRITLWLSGFIQDM